MDMAAETVLLPLTVALVVIIVEPGFADTDHAGMRGARDQLGRVDVGMMVGVVRMDTDTGPDVAVRLRHRENVVPLGLARRDVEHRGDALCARARQNLILLLGKSLVIEVTVRIDEHQASPSPPIASAGSSRRGKIGTGCPTVKPLATSWANQSSSASAAKSRASHAIPIWSSNASAAAGTTGRMAIARVRTAWNKVIRTARIRSGSVLRRAQGACVSTY